ncbi:hypothetical protein GCM10025771_10050 [Niveibacterium umoris]
MAVTHGVPPGWVPTPRADIGGLGPRHRKDMTTVLTVHLTAVESLNLWPGSKAVTARQDLAARCTPALHGIRAPESTQLEGMVL